MGWRFERGDLWAVSNMEPKLASAFVSMNRETLYSDFQDGVDYTINGALSHDDNYVMFKKEGWLAWMTFSGIFAALLVFDHFVLNRNPAKLTVAWAIIYTLFYISCAGVFCGCVFYYKGEAAAYIWMSGYMLEWMLSFDNLFVFHTIFSVYATPDHLKHRPLYLGILGAIVFRLASIFIGEYLMHAMFFMHLIFGFFLIYTGVKTVTADDEDEDPSQLSLVKWLQAHALVPLIFRIRISEPRCGHSASGVSLMGVGPCRPRRRRLCARLGMMPEVAVSGLRARLLRQIAGQAGRRYRHQGFALCLRGNSRSRMRHDAWLVLAGRVVGFFSAIVLSGLPDCVSASRSAMKLGVSRVVRPWEQVIAPGCGRLHSSRGNISRSSQVTAVASGAGLANKVICKIFPFISASEHQNLDAGIRLLVCRSWALGPCRLCRRRLCARPGMTPEVAATGLPDACLCEVDRISCVDRSAAGGARLLRQIAGQAGRRCRHQGFALCLGGNSRSRMRHDAWLWWVAASWAISQPTCAPDCPIV